MHDGKWGNGRADDVVRGRPANSTIPVCQVDISTWILTLMRLYYEYVSVYRVFFTSQCSFFRFILAFRLAIYTMVPDPDDRTPYSWKCAPYFVSTLLAFLFLAYLTRRPDTYLIRLLITPLVIQGIVFCAYNYVWTTPQLNVYNWGQCASLLLHSLLLT